MLYYLYILTVLKSLGAITVPTTLAQFSTETIALTHLHPFLHLFSMLQPHIRNSKHVSVLVAAMSRLVPMIDLDTVAIPMMMDMGGDE